ncbi:DNA-binding transcriptional LysR family regulator [Cupriavidus gilardii J11]|uniref:DNA-binding transcriptional LysR family regulator n=1 Tax=Cupriavidus gilardii J11 TaxID=936133 RepID=A0A562BUM3_9BURK|nr:LysR family transcriptional regulator [Cupriavidus gilardii]TWG88500.1 DNA-binding transcriptional LysR family regulator [Cupriavidus gilardii J11]
MRGFDLDQLRALVAVADHGTLTAAAPRLHLSQSSVSEQLQKLEQRAGVPLLVRGRRGVVPTPAGERLLGFARRMLDLDAQAMQALQGHTLEGELRLAITDYYRTTEIAGMLRRLRERHPHLRLHVTVMKSAVIDANADTDAFDIGLTMRIVDNAAARSRPGWIPLRREALAWVAAREATAELQAPLPLVLLPDTCSLHQYVIRRIKRSRVPYRISHSASGVAGLQMALAAGLGLSCLNQSALVPGVAALDAATQARLGLPSLPAVEFGLLPARRGEAEFVAAARRVLVEQLS